MRDVDVSRSVLKFKRAQLLATAACLMLGPCAALAQGPATPTKPAMTAADESVIDQIVNWFIRRRGWPRPRV